MSEEAKTSATESFALYNSDARSDFIAGIIVLVIAGVALAVSIYQSGFDAPVWGPTLAPRVMALLMGAMGIFLIAGKLDVRNPQDFYGGIVLVGVAVAALLISMSLQGMRGFVFGPATAPRMFAVMLGALGGLVVIGGLITKGPQLERYTFRGPVFVLGSILVFAASIRPLGLVITTFLTIIISAGAQPDIKWRQTLVWAIILTAFCSVLFPYGLALPFLLWPVFWY